MQIKIILPITILQKKNWLLTKSTLFSLLIIGTLAEKKQDIPHQESVLFHPVLKAYPTQHSWITTGHILLCDLNRKICMFNSQKILVHKLLVKIQGQPLALPFVLNALQGEFPNIDSIYESYKQTIQSAVQLPKTELENMSPPENLQSKRSLPPFLWDVLKWLTGTVPWGIHKRSSNLSTNWYRNRPNNRRL